MPPKRRNRLTKLMFRAIEDDDVFRVEDLLRKRCVNLRARNKRGMTFLHANAVKGSSAITQHLIKAGCEINALWCGSTPVHEAVQNKNESVARCLILAGANLRIQDQDGDSPLHLAVWFSKNLDNSDLVRLIIQNGVDVNMKNDSGVTALHFACRKGNEMMFNLLLDSGADVHESDENGDTPMHFAASCPLWQGNLRVFQTLLQRGYGGNAPENQDGKTPFHYLVQGNHVDAIRLFLQNGADANTTGTCSGKTALHIAAMNPNAQVLKLVLEQDVNMEQRDDNGMTALLCAVYAFLPNNVRQLVARGVDVHAVDINLFTAVEAVVLRDSDLILEQFDEKDRPNVTEERIQTLRLLLESGAQVDEGIRGIENLLDGAMSKRESRIAEVIVEHIALLDELQLDNKTKSEAINKHQELSVHYKKCRAELTAMRNKISGTAVSFFDVLKGNVNVVVGYARNSELVEAFDRSNYQTEFPIHCVPLMDKMHVALERQRLIENAAIVLSDTLQFLDPCHIAIRITLGYMSQEDMKVLVGRV